MTHIDDTGFDYWLNEREHAPDPIEQYESRMSVDDTYEPVAKYGRLRMLAERGYDVEAETEPRRFDEYSMQFINGTHCRCV